ncbi:phenylacetic acid degradation-related protein [Luminiphilus syltensis NOR5-1B]|uniref:Medium/long-chain acyl-CoA thioesterase YigI n=1 Tax=Luminiphilus syltensis NOR5-1B TaxID=565045 RepID=B8KY20_9GAMM|nr:PaaI family thioesterase [Luminiphilus syltensis]EED34649.1 phenylacetic acid degradation-related protein [Luminiphilus syltensis NOR5-1B]
MPNKPLDLEALATALDSSPFHQLLGLSIESLDDATQTLVMRLRYDDKISRAEGTGQHHGGVIASLIDIAGDFALIWQLGHGVPTINFRTDYLRPGINTDLIAHAQVRKIGRTVSVCDIDVFSEEGKLLAIGRGTYATAAG